MNSLRTASAAMAGLAVILLIVVQFTPWASFETEGGSVFGFSYPGAEMDAYTWEQKASSGGSADKTSWYDSDADDSDGIGRIRAAIPLLVIGLVAALAGAALTFGMRGAMGPIFIMVAALVAIVAVILFSTGLQSAWDGADFKWGAAFYMAIVGNALLLLGGLAGLMSGNRASI